MYILNYDLVEAIAKHGNRQQLDRLNNWLFLWFNSSDKFKLGLLESLARLYSEVTK